MLIRQKFRLVDSISLKIRLSEIIVLDGSGVLVGWDASKPMKSRGDGNAIRHGRNGENVPIHSSSAIRLRRKPSMICTIARSIQTAKSSV